MNHAGTNFIHVAVSGWTNMAIRPDGSIAVWGSDSYCLVSRAPKGNGFTSLGLMGFDWKGVGLAIHGP